MTSALKTLQTFFTAFGASLPTATKWQRGQFAIKRAASTEDEIHAALADSSNAMQWRRIVTKTLADSTYAPIGSKYIVQTADATLTNEQALGSLATGIVKNTTTTGVLSIATAGTDYMSATAPTSPLLFTAAANSATTSSTTDTTNYSVNVSDTFALGSGTWEVHAWGGGMYSHSSASGVVRVRLKVDADTGTPLSMTAPQDTTRGWIGCANSATGLTGTITISLEYRPNSTGTAYAGGGFISATAIRTA